MRCAKYWNSGISRVYNAVRSRGMEGDTKQHGAKLMLRCASCVMKWYQCNCTAKTDNFFALAPVNCVVNEFHIVPTCETNVQRLQNTKCSFTLSESVFSFGRTDYSHMTSSNGIDSDGVIQRPQTLGKGPISSKTFWRRLTLQKNSVNSWAFERRPLTALWTSSVAWWASEIFGALQRQENRFRDV